MNKKFPTLYAITSKGGIKQWTVSAVLDNGKAILRKVYGKYEGKMRIDDKEIGPARKGKNGIAKKEYVKGVVGVFENVSDYLKDGALIFIVANDKFNLYSEIGNLCGFKLIDVFHRPVLMRTERDSNKYFESVFYFKKVKE